MSSGVLGRLSSLTLSVQQLGQLPHLLNWLPRLPLPQATVLASDVPSLFREPYILSGYRPVHLEWWSYFCSLFQCHNELLNVWTHLLAIPAILLQFSLFWVSAWPPICCSHTLNYQYGGTVGVVFLPGASVLAWLSYTSCCYAKFRYHRPYPLHQKICQIIPTSLAYMLDISSVAHRLVTRAVCCRCAWRTLHLTGWRIILLCRQTLAVVDTQPRRPIAGLRSLSSLQRWKADPIFTRVLLLALLP
uniref:Progestin and adipoQ receptor family member VIII n=1 Tax=Sinocyclocheilus anshuiensis TaxID=1608454 RepID=A0A671PP25_9TELE